MEIKMPKLGESVHEGTIEQWLVNEGDQIEEYDPLCEVITDKVTAEVPSSYTGTITKIIAQAGETIEVGAVICEMEVANHDADSSVSTSSEQQEASGTTEAVHAPQSVTSNQDKAGTKVKNNGRFSPVVFRLASEHNIDLANVEGTGFEGRVTKKDIEAYIAGQGTTSQATQTSQTSGTHNQTVEEPVVQELATSHENTHVFSHDNHSQAIPINGVRRQIAKKMVQSVQEIPHAWMKVEVDATELTKTRNHYKGQFKAQEGYNLTYFAFFVKAVAEALKKYPLLNSTWHENEIILHSDVNISIAVAHEDKLFVPVIHHADEKSIKGIAREINELAQKARRHQLTHEDMQGGTFTVNNTGTFGSVSSMGIINHPQAAILQVESIVKRPVVIDDMIAIRQMVNLCLSLDHRILDGLQAGQFLNEVKQRIESYTLEHTQIY
ncbi:MULTISPECIES: dihydrolipoamide acetyltransferase family protein [Staphylococcus]|uniref:Dihydrolipoamide acetyltransferase component of pyruvate dehydrogenase complex n=1 Tax=Staphylococcus schleiferi TaxID=1295 RepID=A0ABX0FYP2_STASC|nr:MULTISPECIES: dihydrolipoamide acetyltransferase family protein [Staphylococcus]QGS45458.1 2-oxo acid dehydrogenase subunit E2 [Mammaliicoccus fleurettii]EPD51763.1 pyruvate dehydrogenase complex dihydrolipoamide acetyltransferase [Staphylococcus sp. HGB0015]NHA34179.1 2-oxo acid dehydrogenase subunit E2 [Staphylococcus schleiferi]NHA38857.1 2-oxo acid dehydrogenase subunit E2 [Staphylococcus schleiferi]NHA40946.1 2-oxo acid dehydrogenase subunit E2 [Staphylococcus schleiferi]